MGYLETYKQNNTTKYTFYDHLEKMDHTIPHIYVDGSYDTKRQIAGWAFIVILNHKMIYQNNGYVNDLPYCSRNITGEVTSAICALQWAEVNKYSNVIIIADYMGVCRWAVDWKAKRPIAIKYKQYLNDFNLQCEFRHVKGHSGCLYNELVDQLAEQGKYKEEYLI